MASLEWDIRESNIAEKWWTVSVLLYKYAINVVCLFPSGLLILKCPNQDSPYTEGCTVALGKCSFVS